MTVIQPIFYGGSSDIKLKALTSSIGSLVLSKNQSADLQITPIMDLSNVDLYDVSCDDSRVQLIKQPNHALRVVTPDEKFPSTTQTVIHFRATDDSGVSLDVPLTLQAGLSEAEARSWFESHSSPKQLTSSFEPVPGWRPFKDCSSGAEIIARAIRDSQRYMVNIGDYFDEMVNGTTYRWTVAEFNHYGQNEALMVPDKLIPGDVVFNSSYNNNYFQSNLMTVFSSFYNSMPSSLRSCILYTTLPWTDKNGSTSHLGAYVFPPSEFEAFGEKHYSKESSSDYKQWACFTGNSSRVRSGRAYWLRSTHGGDLINVPIAYSDGSYGYDNSHRSHGAFPCFCIA